MTTVNTPAQKQLCKHAAKERAVLYKPTKPAYGSGRKRATQMASYKAKKATFTVAKNKAGERVFTAVNKRAHTVVRKLGKRKHVSVQDLRNSVGAGTYQFWAYGSDSNLSRIRF